MIILEESFNDLFWSQELKLQSKMHAKPTPPDLQPHTLTPFQYYH